MNQTILNFLFSDENNSKGSIGLQMLGLTHSAVSYLVEQLPGAREAAECYKFRHHIGREAEEALKENPSGSARSEPYRDRKPLDMFSWLASRHRLVNILRSIVYRVTFKEWTPLTYYSILEGSLFFKSL